MPLLRPLLALAAIALFDQMPTCANEVAAGEHIRWHTDLASAEREAMRTGKPLLVVIGATWDCGTKEYTHVTFRDARVIARVRAGYTPVQLDVSDDEEPAARHISERFRVLGVPTTLVLTPDARGELGRTSSYMRPPEFARLLDGCSARASDASAPTVSPGAPREQEGCEGS